MGSIVKSIGKAIKGIGKALKKIAPILLVAAAVYVGYGFMTGFQSGGWPAIKSWGQSLMGGVSQGQTISSAANAATQTVGAVDATAITNAMASGAADATATGLGAQTATALPTSEVASTVAQGATGMLGQTGEVASTVAEAGNWATEAMTQSGQSLTSLGTEIGTGWKDVTSGVLESLKPISTAYGAPSASVVPTMPTSSFVNRSALEKVMSDQFTGTGPGLAQAVTPGYGASGNLYEGLITAAGEKELALNSASLPGKIASLGKKAWNTYKKMWSDNPGMAMWTTNNVLRTILAMLDDTAEKESYARRHVMGFAPGGWDEVAKRYGGNLPGGKGGGAGYSTAGSRRPSSGIKTGPTPEVGRSRTSAIDRKPGGIIGSNPQRMLS